jgi:hypothetical protein
MGRDDSGGRLFSKGRSALLALLTSTVELAVAIRPDGL